MLSDIFEIVSDCISVLWKLNLWPRLCLCHSLPVELQEWMRCKPNTYYANNYANQTWAVVFGTADDSYCVLSKAKMSLPSRRFVHGIHIQLHIMTYKYIYTLRQMHTLKRTPGDESSLSMSKTPLCILMSVCY